MIDATLSVPLPRLTLTVKMPRAYGFRLWLASWVFRFGGLVANCGVTIEA